MDWSHGMAFCFGYIVFILSMVVIPKRRKDIIITRRDLLACHIYPALQASSPQASRYDLANEAVRNADVLIDALDHIKPLSTPSQEF